MKIKISYFASLREEIGRDESTVKTNDVSLTPLTAWTLATGRTALPSNILVAVNQEYVAVDSLLTDGDEVAFFPPVTGG
jgi:molybdopterin synthase sulfur carrier subunit